MAILLVVKEIKENRLNHFTCLKINSLKYIHIIFNTL